MQVPGITQSRIETCLNNAEDRWSEATWPQATWPQA